MLLRAATLTAAAHGSQPSTELAGCRRARRASCVRVFSEPAAAAGLALIAAPAARLDVTSGRSQWATLGGAFESTRARASPAAKLGIFDVRGIFFLPTVCG